MESVRGPNSETEFAVAHLFRGHEFRPGASIEFSTKNSTPDRSLTLAIRELTADDNPAPTPDGRRPRLLPPVPRLVMAISGVPKPIFSSIPLTRRGAMSSESLEVARRPRRNQIERPKAAQYIATDFLSADELAASWNEITLTDLEEHVLRALRYIDPNVERIAPIVPTEYYYPYALRGGFKVKLKGSTQPIPIGSLGDGIWRMFATAISLICSKDGVLLIDEIDTGLHYTVMSDLWRLIHAAATDSNIQVFATTHSYDCIHSLATICNENVETNSDVTIQRIEAGKAKTIPYSEAEIKEAAKRYIEVR